MLGFLGKELIRFRTARAPSTTSYQVYFLQTQSLESSINNDSILENQQSPTISYLLNSCGFSLESAISASKKINISSKNKADSVLEVFREHGFTETQINSFITKRPSLLVSLPHKTLAPKIEFFKSLGLSTPDLAKLIYKEPLVLLRGLESEIKRSWNFFRHFLHTDKDLLTVLSRSFRVLQHDMEKAMGPNMLTLRNFGLPESKISKLLMIQPMSLMQNKDRFEKSAGLAKEMGFETTSIGFAHAIRALMQSESTWNRKMELLKRYGLSEEEVLAGFRLQPLCLISSEQKIKKMMDFLVNKLNCKASVVSQHPILLMLSLEKRLIPRCSVMQLLMSKGLVKKDIHVVHMFKLSEKEFMERFVAKYQEQVPEVINANLGMIKFEGFTESINLSGKTLRK